MRRHFFLLLGTALVPIWLGMATADSVLASDVRYRIVDLGVDFYPIRISEAGIVVGRGPIRGDGPALLWDDGIVTNLGVGEAHDINEAGQVVIWSGGPNFEPALWQAGSITPLDIRRWGGDFRHIYSIGAAGQVIGQTAPEAVDMARAFVWQNNVVTYLHPPGVYSSAHGINDSGQIVGWYSLDNLSAPGFLWDQGVVTTLPEAAIDINNHGVVATTTSIWDSRLGGDPSENEPTSLGVMTPLAGSVPNGSEGLGPFVRAQAINDTGQVVGWYDELYLIDAESGHGAWHRAFLWTSAGGMRDLWELVDDAYLDDDGRRRAGHIDFQSVFVADVNNAGQIVGYAGNRGFVLTPVPEPTTSALLGGAIALAMWAARRQRSRLADATRRVVMGLN